MNTRCTVVTVTLVIHSQQGEWECSSRWQGWTKPKKITWLLWCDGFYGDSACWL